MSRRKEPAFRPKVGAAGVVCWRIQVWSSRSGIDVLGELEEGDVVFIVERDARSDKKTHDFMVICKLGLGWIDNNSSGVWGLSRQRACCMSSPRGPTKHIDPGALCSLCVIHAAQWEDIARGDKIGDVVQWDVLITVGIAEGDAEGWMYYPVITRYGFGWIFHGYIESIK